MIVGRNYFIVVVLIVQSCVSPEGKAYREKEEKWNRPMETILKCEAIQRKSRSIDSAENTFSVDSMIVNRRKLYDRSIVTEDLKKIYAYKKGNKFIKFKEVILVNNYRIIQSYYIDTAKDEIIYLYSLNTTHQDSLTFTNFKNSQPLNKGSYVKVFFQNGSCFDYFDSPYLWIKEHREEYLQQHTEEANTILKEFKTYFTKEK